MEQNNQNNVYAPPSAPVADPDPERVVDKPGQVTLAVWLLGTAIGLSVLRNVIYAVSVQTPFAMQKLVTIAFTSLFIVAINGWIIYKISSGRNWARILKLITSVFSVTAWLMLMLLKNFQPDSYSQYFAAVDQQPLGSKVIDLVNLVLLVFIMFLLFTRPGSDWFKKREQ